MIEIIKIYVVCGIIVNMLSRFSLCQLIRSSDITLFLFYMSSYFVAHFFEAGQRILLYLFVVIVVIGCGQGCESRRQTFSSITRPTFREFERSRRYRDR
jgi:hypothetical protein